MILYKLDQNFHLTCSLDNLKWIDKEPTIPTLKMLLI
jgi:hypothetical protein